MAKITLNGVDALTESGGTVTIPAATNLNLGTGAVPSAAIQDDAVTSAKLDTNIAVAGTLGVTGATTLSGATACASTLAVTGATTLSSTLAVTGAATFSGDIKGGTIKAADGTAAITIANSTGAVTLAGDLTVSGTTTTVDTALTVSDATIINNAGSDVGLKINSTSTGHIMQLQDNGTDVMVVKDGGNVGVGTNAPDTSLHIWNGSAGTVDTFSDTHFSIERNDTTGVSILAPTDKLGVIRFGTDGDPTRGSIKYFHSAYSTTAYRDALVLCTGDDATRMVIDSSGHITPGADATQDFGTPSLRWGNIYVADMNFSNEGTGGNEIDGTTGEWTIQEGDENLFVLNRKTGKKFKMNLTEI